MPAPIRRRATRKAQGVSAYRLARRMGLTDVAALLRDAGAADDGDEMEAFIAACARADRTAVGAMRARDPRLIDKLTVEQLHLPPDLAAAGADDAVRVMVEAVYGTLSFASTARRLEARTGHGCDRHTFPRSYSKVLTNSRSTIGQPAL